MNDQGEAIGLGLRLLFKENLGGLHSYGPEADHFVS
jgi:hypothetical protein